MPVGQDIQPIGEFAPTPSNDQKPARVRAHAIRQTGNVEVRPTEENLRTAEFERVERFDRHPHPAQTAAVEQLVPSGRPLRFLVAAARGYLPTVAGWREGLDPNLVVPSFVGGVGHEVAAGGKGDAPFARVCSAKRHPICLTGDRPNVESSVQCDLGVRPGHPVGSPP